MASFILWELFKKIYFVLLLVFLERLINFNDFALKILDLFDFIFLNNFDNFGYQSIVVNL